MKLKILLFSALLSISQNKKSLTNLVDSARSLFVLVNMVPLGEPKRFPNVALGGDGSPEF